MKTNLPCILAITVLITGDPSQVLSQAPTTLLQSSSTPASQNADNQANKLEAGTNEFGVWGGGSFDSPTLIGTAKGRKLFLLGLRYGRVLGGTRSMAVAYTVDAIPVALVFQPDIARQFNRRNDAVVYGAGLSPLGFQFIFNRRGRVKPFAGLSGGFLYSRRPIPVDTFDATHFNFTFDFGGGAQFFTDSRHAVILGYKFHHISNANRSRVNPGLDGSLFYIGFSFFR
jgi:hypothetical protein